MVDLSTVYRKVRQGIGKPMWADCPVNIQFDTTGKCNLQCVYCNPQNNRWSSKADIDFEIVKTVLDYFKGKPLWSVAPFMNGEPLLYKDLTRFLDYAQKCRLPCVLDSNGTCTENRHLLVHPNLKVVRITISAVTPETYERVHGKPYFDKAVSTIEWLKQNKLPNQELWIHFIENKHNAHERQEFLKRFHDVNITVFPIHSSVLQPNSVSSDSGGEKFKVYAGGRVEKFVHRDVPCQCWDTMNISLDGKIIQCSDFPDKVNYGKVGEVDLLEAWKQRNLNRMDNIYCKTCSLRLPNWEKVMRKYVQG
jgi:MoaA/NifB/PqqE/SkfB family radical SAM enzyme